MRDGMRWTMKPWRYSRDGEMLLPRNALSARLLFVSGRGGLADIKVSNAATNSSSNSWAQGMDYGVHGDLTSPSSCDPT